MSCFLCIWIPQFSAWTLTQSEPSLAKQPFVICEKGKVFAVSALALEAGVLPGMSNGRAQSRCPQVLLVARDRNREAMAWSEVQRALYGLTPQVESVKPGLLYADVEAKKALPLIHSWGAYAGQACDRSSAYLTALTSTGGEARCLRSGREASFADRVPLEALIVAGLSLRSLERLQWFGWKTVGALRILSRRQLEEQVGAEGNLLYRMSQGPRCPDNIGNVTTWTPPVEITGGIDFELPAREPCDWDEALDELLRRICTELGSRSAQSLEIIAQTPIAPVAARRLLKEPTSQPQSLERPARSALAQALQLLAPLPPVVQGLEVRLGHLTVQADQSSLFEEHKNEPSLRPNRLKGALERIEARFSGKAGRFVCEQPHSAFPEDVYAWLPALEEVARQKAKDPKKAVR